MGQNTKLITSVIPHQFSGDELKFDVFFTPRLPDSGKLRDYYEIRNWPLYKDIFTAGKTPDLEIYAERADDGTPDLLHYDIKPQLLQPPSYYNDISDIWESIFEDDTPVSGWILYNTSYKLADAITLRALRQKIHDAIDECVRKIVLGGNTGDADDPYGTNIDDLWRKQISSLALYLEQLKDRPIAQLIIDPILQNNRFRPYLNELFKALVKIEEQWKEELKQKQLQYALQEVERKNYEETHEFHKRLSAYGNHPHLLKKAAWILEYKATIPADLRRETRNLFIRVSEKGYQKQWEKDFPARPELEAFFQEVNFFCPYTAIQLQEFPVRENKTLRSNFSISKGMINVKSEEYNYEIEANIVDRQQLLLKISDVINKDFGGAALAQPDQRLSADERNRLDVTSTERLHLAEEINRAAGVAEYVSSGITITIHNLKKIVETAVVNNVELGKEELGKEKLGKPEEIMQTKAFLYGNNIYAGYRVDVIGLAPDKRSLYLGSLCKKNETFKLKNGRKQLPSFPSEGWICESIQGGRSGQLYADEELFRWNDWSLVAAQAGQHTNIQARDNELNIESRAESLPRLRFGYTYSFRLRLTDIGGNGAPPVNALTAPCAQYRTYLQTHKEPPGFPEAGFWTKPLPYQRVDPINAPFLIAGDPLFGESRSDENRREKKLFWLNNRWGEDVPTIVIRAYHKGNRLETKQRSCRYIGPPKANLNFVLQHGVLDHLLKSDPGAYRKEILTKADSKINEDSTFYMKRQKEVDYLFDPLVDGYEMIIDHKVEELELPIGKVSSRTLQPSSGKYWENKNYYLLILENEDGDEDYTVQHTVSRNSTLITLKQGHEKEGMLRCRYFENIHNGIGNDSTSGIFYPGIALAKRTNFRVVHAVEKPCLLFNKYLPGNENFLERIGTRERPEVRRQAGLSDARISLSFDLFPVLTAESYLLHIQFIDFFADRSSEKGFRLQDVDKVIKTGFYPENAENEKEVLFANLVHVFDNTRYRLANYQVEAVSKFKKFFDPSSGAGAFSVYGNITGVSNPNRLDHWRLHNEMNASIYHNILKTNSNWLTVPSTTRPDAPVIERIVPLLRWNEQGCEVERICDTVRIYFEGDWYSTGANEQVAVMCMHESDSEFSSANVIEFHDGLASWIDTVISQFGHDPAAGMQTLNVKTMPVRLTPSVLVKGCKGELADKVDNICLDQMEFEKPENPAALRGRRLSAAVFPIQYLSPKEIKKNNAANGYDTNNEEVLGKYYVDVTITDLQLRNLYTPFVRFAIARYQANSIPATETVDFRFSPIVITDFIQLLPYRKLVFNASNITYIAPAFRTNGVDPKDPSNKVFVFPDEPLIAAPALFDSKRTDDPPYTTAGIQVDEQGKMAPVPRQPGKDIVIAEYEVYNMVPELTPDTKDPREDYTHRLIFSYVYNNKAFTKNCKTTEDDTEKGN